MAEAIELTEDSTSEDIEAAVDQIIADRTADEPVEPTGKLADEGFPAELITSDEASDAEIVGEDDVTTERDTTEENRNSSGSDSKKTGKEESADDWRDEAVAEASAYGFSEDDIADFQSREEFDRAMKLFDRQMDAEREKLNAPEGDDKASTTETEGKTSDDKASSDGRYEVKLSRDEWDDVIVDEIEGLRDHYEARLSAIEQRFQEEAALAEEERFDRTVDDIGFADLFGKTGKESDKELKTREKLLEHVIVEQAVLQRMGRPVGDYKALVLKVARGVFPDEFDKKLLKNHTRKISRQSNGRQGGGATRPNDPPQTLKEEMRQRYKELEQAG